MARDLTKLEQQMYAILARQIEDERPHRVMCDLADRFLALWNAYEKLKKERCENK